MYIILFKIHGVLAEWIYHKKALFFSNSITCRLNVARSSLSVALQEIWLGNIPWPGDIQQAFEQFIRVCLFWKYIEIGTVHFCLFLVDAVITLYVINPFLKSEPSHPLETALPTNLILLKAVGMLWSLTWKLGCFTQEKENSHSPFSPSYFCCSFLLSPLAISLPLPWQSSVNCITLSSLSAAATLSKQVLYELTPTQRNMGQQKEKTLVNFN